MNNIRYKNAVILKAVLIVILLFLAFWICYGQSPGKPEDYPQPYDKTEIKLSPADMYARLCEQEVTKWKAPKALPGNMLNDRIHEDRY